MAFSSASVRTFIWLPIPVDTFWPVCLVKKRINTAEMAELYFKPHLTKPSITACDCKVNQMQRTMYSTRFPLSVNSMHCFLMS